MYEECEHTNGSTHAVTERHCGCRSGLRGPRRHGATGAAASSGQRGWRSHSLTDAERDMLRARSGRVACDPYRDLPAFRDTAATAWAELTPETQRLVADLGAGTSPTPELYIDNLPRPDQLPPTPVDNTTWQRSTSDTVSEFLMMVFCAGLGHPISYLDQRDGNVFHDVYPTRANAAALSSQSSQVDLGHHTEMFFDPVPPDVLMLHCLRSDPEQTARTSVAAVEDIEARVDPEIRSVLRLPRFALDLAHLHGSYLHCGEPITQAHARPVIPIITEDQGMQFRFEPALMTPVGDLAREALECVEHAAAASASTGVLREGGLLLVDNRRAAHSRSRFPSPFDGTDRWLRRVMVGRGDPTAGEAMLMLHDFELVQGWRERGALIDTVPYPSTSRRS